MNLQRIRVPTGLAFCLAYLYFCQPDWTVFSIGLMPALLGYLIRVWASGHLYKWKGLAVTGPYAWTRNPLYLGSFVMGLGFMAASGRLSLLIAFLVLYVLIYVPVMRKEEGELISAYADKYRAFRERVPLFVPRIPRPGRSDTSRPGFSWKQVIENREHRTGLGFVLVSLVLLAKLVWR